jgi:hypothetical protein
MERIAGHLKMRFQAGATLAAWFRCGGLVQTSPQPFGLPSRGHTCALRCGQIHLGGTDETVFELFERALSFKRFLARLVRGGAAAKAVE